MLIQSGSMRIGKDMILLTKKDGIYTALFVSKTFLEHESTNEVIIYLYLSPLYIRLMFE